MFGEGVGRIQMRLFLLYKKLCSCTGISYATKNGKVEEKEKTVSLYKIEKPEGRWILSAGKNSWNI